MLQLAKLFPFSFSSLLPPTVVRLEGCSKEALPNTSDTKPLPVYIRSNTSFMSSSKNNSINFTGAIR